MDSIWERRRSSLLRKTHLMAGLAIATLTGISSLMAMTNPDEVAYESFITQRLIAFLHENICAEAPETFNLRRDCLSLVKDNRSQLRGFIANNTYRHNFVFFSLYTTELSIASFTPTHRMQTLGIFNQFYPYEAIQE